MTARVSARRLVFQAALLALGAVAVAALSPACYSGASGSDPPAKTFYFPVGLAVSTGGNVLYVANSDFDLQWNGGTLQSYDLFRVRHDAAELMGANFLLLSDPGARATVQDRLNHDIRFARFGDPGSSSPLWLPNCQSRSTPLYQGDGTRVPLGQECSPPVDSTGYWTQSKTIGAFATELQLSRDGTRLFSPVRGNTTLTWADVVPDTRDSVPPADAAIAANPGSWPDVGGKTPFQFDCGSGTRCDSVHETGAVPTTIDTRGVTLPGEPFAMAQTEDGTAIAITHQASQETSLLLSGLSSLVTDPSGAPVIGTPKTCDSNSGVGCPSMQFVMNGVPVGGDGIAAVPHDPDGPVRPCEAHGDAAHRTLSDVGPCVRPAFLETTHGGAEIDLLRYYDDDGSSLKRPFLVREVAYTLAANAGGTDSRGIVIDPTPRIACKARAGADVSACAKLPARVFFASRTPPSLVLGEIGGPPPSADGSYDPDRLVIIGNVPLSAGPAKVYLAPIVDPSGHYALRVFITCLDSNQIFVYDPEARAVESVINVGAGPFAMAFDPFSLDDVARGKQVEMDPRQQDAALLMLGIDTKLKRYRFAYVASFTLSYLQLIDLDNSTPQSPVTFERPVFTLGQPTRPKGT